MLICLSEQNCGAAVECSLKVHFKGCVQSTCSNTHFNFLIIFPSITQARLR